MEMALSTQLMYSVMFIEMLDGTHKPIGSATGFLFSFCEDGDAHIPCLVTNRHVLTQCSFVKIPINRKNDDGTPDIGNAVPVEISTSDSICHPNPDIDLSILPITQAIHWCRQNGASPFLRMFNIGTIPSEEEWQQFSAIENVVMAGFPRGFRDQKNNQPIIRSGITATNPSLDFNGKPVFLVDMPCFEGCSGSPILICDEGLVVNKRNYSVGIGASLKLLGVQFAIPSDDVVGKFVPVKTGATFVPVVPLYMSLGYVIKSSELLAFESILRAKYGSQPITHT